MFLVLAGFYLVFQIFAPYLSAIFLAVVLAILFNPVYLWIKKRVRVPSLSSFLTVLCVLVIILGPVSFFGFLLFQESTDLYTQIVTGGQTAGVLETTTATISNFIEKQIPGSGQFIENYVNVRMYAGQALRWIASHSSDFLSSFARSLLAAFLLVLGLFYCLRDGERLAKQVVDLSPLKDTHDRIILSKIKLAVNSVIRGHLIIAVIQGLLTGLGFAIFGVPSPVIWGFVAAIASFIPSVGTGLVVAPAILFLFLTGNVFQAIGLLVWGIIVIGLVDNLLGPVLIERGIKIHPFLILISVLGGIELFGPVGFIAGPVVLALLVALLEIYPVMVERVANEQKA